MAGCRSARGRGHRRAAASAELGRSARTTSTCSARSRSAPRSRSAAPGSRPRAADRRDPAAQPAAEVCLTCPVRGSPRATSRARASMSVATATTRGRRRRAARRRDRRRRRQGAARGDDDGSAARRAARVRDRGRGPGDADRLDRLAAALAPHGDRALHVAPTRGRLASAGHLPPVLASRDGTARLLEGGPSPPLGARAGRREVTVRGRAGQPGRALHRRARGAPRCRIDAGSTGCAGRG